MNREIITDVAVIGGGPAGMTAAITAAERGKKTVLLEKNERMGRKLMITGKGRCNLTNDCTSDELINNVPVGGKFLYSAFSSFSSRDTVNMFELLGVPLKTERGGRIFPVSDKAADVVDALTKAVNKSGVHIIKQEVKYVEKTDNFIIKTKDYSVFAKSLIIATGGISYPGTGSTGDGYKFAKSFSHTVTELRPALIPIITEEKDASEMQGLSLKNVVFKLYKKGKAKPVYEELGEMLFTHFGVSGPLVLTGSCYIDEAPENYFFSIDFKPALTYEMLDKRLLRDFSENMNKTLRNTLGLLLPAKAINTVLVRSGTDGEKKVNSVSAEERGKLIETIKNFTYNVKGLRPISEAIITRGGVSTKEINPKTMESKLIPGLYFAGEVIDVNAFTGGYNLQIAFSTGKKAGNNV